MFRVMNERGLTLLEVTVVMVLATLVMFGMVGFYLNSQSTWIEASTQALTQRDATLLVERITAKSRVAAAAVVDDVPDSLHQTLILLSADNEELHRFWWDSEDSLIHEGVGVSDDRGPVVTSKVRMFRMTAEETVIHLDSLMIQGAGGQVVRIHSTVRFYNRT